MKTKPLVVIPAFNERNSIETVIDSVRRTGLDVVVVDDGSTDGTDLVARSQGVVVLRLMINQGVGSALRCGFRWAIENGYQSVVQVDGDGQHDPAFIADLLETAEATKAHLVIGSRFAHPDMHTLPGANRQLVMRMMAASVSKFAGQRLTDVTSGFRLIRLPLLSYLSDSMPSYYLGDTFETALVAAKSGYVVTEVPVKMGSRLFGKSTASASQAIAMIIKTFAVTVLGMHFVIPRSDI